MEHIHYLLNQEELRRKYKSNATFRPRAACGNGQIHYRIKTTREKKKITCPMCIAKLTL